MHIPLCKKTAIHREEALLYRDAPPIRRDIPHIDTPTANDIQATTPTMRTKSAMPTCTSKLPQMSRTYVQACFLEPYSARRAGIMRACSCSIAKRTKKEYAQEVPEKMHVKRSSSESANEEVSKCTICNTNPSE
eukprot:2831757-Amphidinium_carterae.1